MQAPPDVVAGWSVLAQPARSLRRLLSYPARDVAEQRPRVASEQASLVLVLLPLTSVLAPRRPRAGPDELRWCEPFSAHCRPRRYRGPSAALIATTQPLSAG